MKLFFAISIILILFSSCKSKVIEDYSTPEATLNTFISATEQWDTEVLVRCMDNDKMASIRRLKIDKEMITSLYRNSKYKFFRKTDSTASFVLTGKEKGGLLFLKEDGNWKIVSYQNSVVNPFK